MKTQVPHIASIVLLAVVGCNRAQPPVTNVTESTHVIDEATIVQPSSEPELEPFNVASEESESLITERFQFVQMPPTESGDRSVAAGLAIAKERGLKPFIYYSAAWCRPCQAINHSIRDSRMQDALVGTYIMKFEIDEWEKLPTAFEISKLPMFFEVDDQGRPTGRTISGGAWDEDIPENMAPALKQFFAVKTE